MIAVSYTHLNLSFQTFQIFKFILHLNSFTLKCINKSPAAFYTVTFYRLIFYTFLFRKILLIFFISSLNVFLYFPAFFLFLFYDFISFAIIEKFLLKFQIKAYLFKFYNTCFIIYKTIFKLLSCLLYTSRCV